MSQFLLGLASVLSFAQAQRKQEAKPKRQEQENKVAKLQAEIVVLERKLTAARAKVDEAARATREAISKAKEGKAAVVAALQARVEELTVIAEANRVQLFDKQALLVTAYYEMVEQAEYLQAYFEGDLLLPNRIGLVAALTAWSPTDDAGKAVKREGDNLAKLIYQYLTEIGGAPILPGDSDTVSSMTIKAIEITLTEQWADFEQALAAWGTGDTSDEAEAVRENSRFGDTLAFNRNASAEYNRIEQDLIRSSLTEWEAIEEALKTAIGALREANDTGSLTASILRKATLVRTQFSNALRLQTDMRGRASSRLSELKKTEAGT